MPTPGPQTEAYLSEADEIFYGGAAGGGKTELVIGLALTQHRRSIVFRRESKQLQAIIDRLTELLEGRDGFNSQTGIWRMAERQIELGGVKNPGDEIAYQGRPHDLKAFDEITHFQEAQFRFLKGWLRSTDPNIRQRVVCTGNPPTDAEGEWVIRYWAPWLDEGHPNPAEPGELRWFAMLDGQETELLSGEPFMHKGDLIKPRSRTFIPSKVEDNPFLMDTDYKATLQALPEPLRSQMLQGNFGAGMEDDAFQVIPTAWVKKAQERWTPDGKRGKKQTALGMDIARGGRDTTVLAPRYEWWYDELKEYPGTSTPDGPSAAALAVAAVRDGAPIQPDVIGVGASVYDHLRQNKVAAVAMNSSERDANATDRSGKLRFVNNRAMWWWRFRESLDPDHGDDLALPPDRSLLADLVAPRWKLTARGIQVESKEDIFKRIGRSTNKGDAAVYALPTNTVSDDFETLPAFDGGEGGWMGN